jgi:hypothetical protein
MSCDGLEYVGSGEKGIEDQVTEDKSKDSGDKRDESDTEINDIEIDIAEGYHSDEEEKEKEEACEEWVVDGPPSSWFDDPQRGSAFETAFTEV